ncbi:hypothetical protein, partial [Carboxylicivirga taeanensis]|uniref:hypothetical protein n=1 Tax=Carboxylicivirga taeanensis TaxID=1416875 RepID=UPI003F6E40FB
VVPHKANLQTNMSRQQKIYLVTAISAVLTGLLLSHFYRPYVYLNQVNDYGFADTIGSLVSVIGFCFFAWSFKNYQDTQKNKHIIIATIIYGFVWESMGLIGIHGTFDWKDIVGAIVSGVIAFLIKELIKRLSGTQNLVEIKKS